MASIVSVLEGEALLGADAQVAGRVWVSSRDPASGSGVGPGDVVVVGDREDAQRAAIELGAALLVTSNGLRPADDVVELARSKGIALVVSPLDSYVTGRMITLAAPCSSVMDADPLTVRPDDVLSDFAEAVKDVHYNAAVAIDTGGRPVGLVTRSTLVGPEPRRVILVDHAEQGQSVPGVDEAEIVEILDHHHIGSVETAVPVRAIFDPVGSTATLVVERFRQDGMEPSRPTATLLLGAVLSDTVILNSPTTTERDHVVVEYFERTLGIDARQFGREMFEATADLSETPAEEVVTRDAKHYEVGDSETTVHRPDRDRRHERPGPPRRAPRRDARAARAPRLRELRAHGHRHPRQGDDPARRRRGGPRRAGARGDERRRRDRPSRRDEPQEAAGSAPPGDLLSREPGVMQLTAG